MSHDDAAAQGAPAGAMYIPGPWRWTSMPHGVMTENGVVLADVYDPGPAYGGEATQDGHCRLMAAAPDLLEALARLLRFTDELCRDVGVSTHYPSAENARRAIARAVGPRATDP